MYLESLSITQYKNIDFEELNFSSSLNCFVGVNGSGKTNILDAIHYLSLTKAAAALPDKRCVKHDKEFFLLKGKYCSMDESLQYNISASYQRNRRKKFMHSGKEYERLSEHIGRFPLVMVSPQDVALISEAAQHRRNFMNTLFSQVDSSYLQQMVRYNAILEQRNSLLKNFGGDSTVLEIISDQLSYAGQRIYEMRGALIKQLSPIVAEFYSAISGDREQITVRYDSRLHEAPMSELLRQNLERDIVLGYTSRGIHRDDIELLMDDYPIRGMGSQGQQKSLLLAIKLAEAKMIEKLCGKKALLLLDDVFDKLDMTRVENLVKLVSGEGFGQIFITDANKIRLEGIVERFDKNYKMFELLDGKII